MKAISIKDSIIMDECEYAIMTDEESSSYTPMHTTEIVVVSEKEREYLNQVDEGYLGFTHPFSFAWFFSIAGAEYCHTYFWTCKDLAWTQEWRFFSLSFGISAMIWWSIIIYNAIKVWNLHEIYNAISLFLWLFANFWWMTGEVYDITYPDEKSISDRRTNECAHILEFAVLYLLFYYIVIIPFDWFKTPKAALDKYDDGSTKPRLAFYFQNFRQYENLHMFFWLSKDLAWNRNNKAMWFTFLVPTVVLSVDYLILSYKNENAIVDTVHYATQLFWVLGNSVWALGEFFNPKHDEAIGMWKSNSETWETARWYSSWLLFMAFVPVIVLYSVWIPLTLSGKLSRRKRRKLKQSANDLTKHGSYGTNDDGYMVCNVDIDSTTPMLKKSDSKDYDDAEVKCDQDGNWILNDHQILRLDKKHKKDNRLLQSFVLNDDDKTDRSEYSSLQEHDEDDERATLIS